VVVLECGAGAKARARQVAKLADPLFGPWVGGEQLLLAGCGVMRGSGSVVGVCAWGCHGGRECGGKRRWGIAAKA